MGRPDATAALPVSQPANPGNMLHRDYWSKAGADQSLGASFQDIWPEEAGLPAPVLDASLPESRRSSGFGSSEASSSGAFSDPLLNIVELSGFTAAVQEAAAPWQGSFQHTATSGTTDKAKAAQKRYRERKKSAMQDTQSRLAEAEAQLAELTAAREAAAVRNALLEKVAHMWEADDLVADDQDCTWMDAATRQKVETGMDLGGPDCRVVLTVQDEGPITMSRHQIGTMSFARYSELQRQYTNKYAQLLPRLQRFDFVGGHNQMTTSGGSVYGEACPAAIRLARLTYEMGAMRCILAMDSPRRWQHWAVLPAEAAAPSYGDTPAFEDTPQAWLRVVAALQLTEAQKLSLVQLRRAVLHNLALLSARRRVLTQILQACQPNGDSHINQSERELRAAEAVEQLRLTISQEYSFRFSFFVAIHKNVLRTVQGSTLEVLTFPYSPDMIALANAVAEAAGELPSPAALQSLQSTELDCGETPPLVRDMARVGDDCCGDGEGSISALQAMVQGMVIKDTNDKRASAEGSFDSATTTAAGASAVLI